MINIQLGDCLELMRDIPDQSIDFVLCDLPYALTNADWDKPIDLDALWKEYHRIAKPNAAFALFAVGKFLIKLANSNFKNYRYKIVWKKNSAVGFLNAKKMPLRAHEDILLFYRKLPTFNPQFTNGKPYKAGGKNNSPLYGKKSPIHTYYDGRYYPKDVLNIGRTVEGHSTAKPVGLLEWLIKSYSNEGETVLDSCMGSGSTGMACVNTNRNFIGMEIEPRFYEIAQKRIAQAELERARNLFAAT